MVLSSLISSKLFGRECPQASVFETLFASIALLYLTLLKTKDQKDTLGHPVPSLQLWAMSSCLWASGPEHCLGSNCWKSLQDWTEETGSKMDMPDRSNLFMLCYIYIYSICLGQQQSRINGSIVHLSHERLYNKFQLLRLSFYNGYTSGLYSEGNPSWQDLCIDC